MPGVVGASRRVWRRPAAASLVLGLAAALLAAVFAITQAAPAVRYRPPPQLPLDCARPVVRNGSLV